jgi:hypothetical protein
MSLDTVLEIGNALRNASDSLKHFKYVSACPTDKDGKYPLCINIPVLVDFSFDWNSISEVPENKKEKLYYLRFKTSDSDGLMKYIFGDIYYLNSVKISKNGVVEKSEGGGFRLENSDAKSPYDKNSFDRAEQDFEDIIKIITDKQKSILIKFRNSLQTDLMILETTLGNISAVEFFLKNSIEVNFLDFIQSQDSVQNATIAQLKEKTSKQNLKKLGIDLEKGELSEEDRIKLLAYDNGEIFIHFDFSNQQQWYSFAKELEYINSKMLSDFVDKTSEGLVLKKTLYKTLCSGDKKNDIQFPNFEINAKHKSKSFSDEAIQDLFYSVEFSKKGKLISGTDIKIIILPKGDNLNAEDYLRFQKKQDEESVKQDNNENLPDDNEPLFNIFEESNQINITSFDVIFSKKGGTTSPDIDLIEISGIEKSKIRHTRERIDKIKRQIQDKRKAHLYYIKKELFSFKIANSFQNILGNPQSDMKTGKVSIKPSPKYQAHILKVLPLIYTDNYYSDDQLFPSFIQIVEYSIRSGKPIYTFLKFDLEFLISIQNNQNNKFMDIIKSSSYQIGNSLGSLAKNFAGENSPIKSFEKNYVGNLSRRISSMADFIRLKNDIEQKLIMHDKTKFTYKTSYDLAQKVKDFKERYDKEECAFGFFEAYFKPIPKKQEISQTED